MPQIRDVAYQRAFSTEPRDCCRLRRWLAISAGALFVVTWKLWTPQVVFPQIPIGEWALGLPPMWDWCGLAICCAAIGSAMLASATSRIGRPALVGFSVGLIGLMLTDQHRWQPWAYQFVVVAWVLAATAPRRAITLLRVLTISIYVYSAFSKIDHSFVHTHGQQLVQGLLQSIGLSTRFWTESQLQWSAAMLPIGELLVAAGLSIPRFRRSALIGSLVMHVMLLAAVGPWGLNHRPGVLLWNVYFLGQNILLFGPLRRQQFAIGMQPEAFGVVTGITSETPGPQHNTSEPSPASHNVSDGEQNMTARSSRSFRGRTISATIAECVVAVVVMAPLLEPWGYFDHWPAWGLYASRSEQTRIDIATEVRAQVVGEIGEFLEPAALGSDWCRVRIDRWSLATLGAPVYPEDRCQRGVALALAQKIGLQDAIRVVAYGPSDRWTGQRHVREYIGREAIRRSLEEFRLNARPRTSQSWIPPSQR